MIAGSLLACSSRRRAGSAPRRRPPTSPTRPRWRSGTRPSFGSWRRPRSAARGVVRRRSTSTLSSASRRSRCAARGSARPREDRAERRRISADRFEYHLDFPGNALEPGCTYELWAHRLTKGAEPTVYAHVATEPGAPGKLALQYWFFYAFNDFNNTHEGDWEMIQLVFDAADAEAGTRRGAGRGRLQLARGGRAGGWATTRSSRSSTGRIRSSTRRQDRTRTSSRRRSTSAARPRPVSAATTRAALTARSARLCITVPSDPACGVRRLPVDHLRGTVGRAPEGVLQRADRPQHEDAVDDADRVVGGLA